MKRTDDDNAYALRFGIELSAAYNSAKERALSDQEFAESVGVVRAQLDKYLRGAAMPSLRTVVMAYRNHGILIPYSGKTVTPIIKAREKRGRRKKGNSGQLELPLVITTEKTSNVDLSLRALGPRKFELQVKLRKHA